MGEPKSDMGEPKSDMGIFPWLSSSDSGHATVVNGASTVSELYRQVASSLQLLEEAVAKTENVVRAILVSSSNGLTHENHEYRQRVMQQVKRSFREIQETMTIAKQTAGLVLTHPAYGLGPTPQQGAMILQQLAMAGGLSSRTLRLL
jgi:hypothetical protein